jgi:acetyl-CoA C-acetyltransferase
MAKEKAAELGLKPLATHCRSRRSCSGSQIHSDCPGLATLKVLKKAGLSVNDVALFEANEAFAAVALISTRIAQWDTSRVNVDGGAVAFGHPIGASGARILMHLAYALRAAAAAMA